MRAPGQHPGARDGAPGPTGAWEWGRTTPRACPLDRREPGIPSCDTGPVGRLRFVAVELRDLWGRRGRKDRPA